MQTKKISDLPTLKVFDKTFLIPCIDALATSTATVTAEQIAELGGGTPGLGTVDTPQIKSGAVLAANVGFTGPDLIITRDQAGAGPGTEFPCTQFGRDWLKLADSTAANTLLNLQLFDNPTFTGQVTVDPGTRQLPSIVAAGQPQTGIFFPGDNTLGFSADEWERLRIGEDGTLFAVIPNSSASTELRNAFFVRAWCIFNGTGPTTTTIKNQHHICQRYRGVWGSLANNAATIAHIQNLETNTLGGGTVTGPYNPGTEGRSNYTSPGNNTHWSWNGTAWVKVAATSSNWIGRITITTAGTVGVIGAGGFSYVEGLAVGHYRLHFSAPMPDTDYAVAATLGTSATKGLCFVQERDVNYVEIRTTTTASGFPFANFDGISVAIFR